MSDRAVWLYNRSLELLNGEAAPKNAEEAFRLNAAAAALGYKDAVLAMGWFHLNGEGVASDLAEACKWYRRSARQGEPKAMFSLGQIAYADRDFSKARKWFERAVEVGHKRSLFWLGKLHWHGRGVSQNKKKAAALFRRASRAKVAEAQRALRLLARRSGRPTTRCS